MRSRLIAAFLLSCSVLAACSGREGPAASAGSADGGTLVIAEPGGPDNLMPPVTISIVGHAVCDLVFDRLAQIGDSMHTIGDDGFRPELADSWSWAHDSLSVAFHLDPRARWHDGVAVRAADVKFSLDLYKNPKIGSQFAPLLANVDSVSVRDSLTAVAWFHHRTPEEFFDVAYQMWILPAHVLDTIPPDKLGTSDAARHPIGSGRFRFAEWQPGSRVVLVADTANYRGRARLDRVIWAIAPDNEAAFTQVLSGTADLLENATPDQLKAVAGKPSLRPFKAPGLQYIFAAFNLRDAAHHAAPNPYLADLRVRRALSMALDRQAMLHNVFDSLGAIGYGPFPRTASTADTTLRLPPHDSAWAAALLDSAGWKMGTDGMRSRNGRQFAIHLIYPTSSAARKSYAVLIQESLRRFGISVAIDGMEFKSFLEAQNAGKFDILMEGVGVDPNIGSAKQAWRSNEGPPDGFNFISYANSHVDALLDSATASFDPKAATGYAHRAYQMIADDAPAVWLYDVVAYGVINTRFQVAPTRPDGWWEHLADWTVPVAQRIDRDRIGLAPAKP